MNKQLQSVSIALPPMPFKDTRNVKIDLDLITGIAQEYCSIAPEQTSGTAFFLGHLPLASADALGGNDLNTDMIARHLGNLAVSGFFGGIWLRDALRDRKRTVGMGTSKLKLLSLGGFAMANITRILPVFAILSLIAGRLTSKARHGSDTSVFRAARASIRPFLVLYGYNWGYFHYILENPPEGVLAPAGYDTVCNRFLDCGLPNVTLNTRMAYSDCLDALYADKSTMNKKTQWGVMKERVDVWGRYAVKSGKFVWRFLMNDQMSSVVYERLIDLSARFMSVAELSVLPAMKGCTENTPVDCRIAILEQAGMIIWAGTYFMGLFSPMSTVPVGTFPKLAL